MIAQSPDQAMERRRSPRVPCRTPVRVYSDDSYSEYFVLVSANISREGIFVCTDLLLSEGECWFLELRVPGRPTPVRSAATVVRAEEYDDLPGPGVAFVFSDLDDTSVAALSRLAGRSN